MPRPRSPVDTAAQRSSRGRTAALVKAAFAPDPMAAARDAKLAMFERAVDPDERLDPDERRRRADRLHRAWMTEVGYQASRQKRGQASRGLVLADWLAAAQTRAAASLEAAQKKAAPRP